MRHSNSLLFTPTFYKNCIYILQSSIKHNKTAYAQQDLHEFFSSLTELIASSLIGQVWSRRELLFFLVMWLILAMGFMHAGWPQGLHILEYVENEPTVAWLDMRIPARIVHTWLKSCSSKCFYVEPVRNYLNIIFAVFMCPLWSGLCLLLRVHFL